MNVIFRIMNLFIIYYSAPELVYFTAFLPEVVYFSFLLTKQNIAMTIAKRILAISILLFLLKKKRRSRRRVWVREWIARRATNDVTQTLIREIRLEDAVAFNSLFRMTANQFDYLLRKVAPFISKKNTNMRQSISAKTRLMITLRYLVTGDSYKSLMFFFRVPHNTISSIIPETCKAIFDVLKSDHLKVLFNVAPPI